MIDPALIEPEKVRPLKRSEYDQLVELGVFEGERIELLRGALVEMTPQGSRHAHVLSMLNRIFMFGLRDRAELRIQMPLAVSEDSEPEPDLAVVPPGDYSQAHPTQALLVVELAESSRRKDRELKAALYAAAGVPEYWLVDLVDRAVEVRTRPEGGAYRDLARFERGTLSPAAFADLSIDLGQILR